MVKPVILFNADEGALLEKNASGAGPTTAITGAGAKSALYGSDIYFFDESPDLSGVATDGSHAIRINSATGRMWTGITAVDNVNIAVTGDISASSNHVTDTDTTLMSVYDTVRIAGAGVAGAAFYTYVTTIVSGTAFDIYGTASTTVNDAAISIPKHVTPASSMSVTAPSDWAIGGKIKTFIGGLQLWSDILPGWTIRLETDHINIETSITLTVSGDTTSGRIVFDTSGNTQTLTADPTSLNIFTLRAGMYTFKNFSFNGCSAGIYSDSSSTSDLIVDSCSCPSSTYLVRFASGSTGSRFNFVNCECASSITTEDDITNLIVENCFFNAVSGNGINVTTNTGLTARHNIFDGRNGLSYGIILQTDTAVGERSIIEHNLFYMCGKGLGIGHIARARGLVVRNNDFYYCSGIGFEAVAGTDYALSINDYNNYYGNATDRSNVSAGEHDTAFDSQFFTGLTDTDWDFRIGTNLAGLGWPSLCPGTTTTTSSDIGYCQRGNSILGNECVRINSISDDGSFYTVSFSILGGTANFVRVDKTIIPGVGVLSLDAIMYAIAAYLRDGEPSDIVGKECFG